MQRNKVGPDLQLQFPGDRREWWRLWLPCLKGTATVQLHPRQGRGLHRNSGPVLPDLLVLSKRSWASRFLCGDFCYLIFLKSFIFREGGEIEGKKHQCVVAAHVAPTGDLARNPGMCPD